MAMSNVSEFKNDNNEKVSQTNSINKDECLLNSAINESSSYNHLPSQQSTINENISKKNTDLNNVFLDSIHQTPTARLCPSLPSFLTNNVEYKKSIISELESKNNEMNNSTNLNNALNNVDNLCDKITLSNIPTILYSEYNENNKQNYKHNIKKNLTNTQEILPKKTTSLTANASSSTNLPQIIQENGIKNIKKLSNDINVTPFNNGVYPVKQIKKKDMEYKNYDIKNNFSNVEYKPFYSNNEFPNHIHEDKVVSKIESDNDDDDDDDDEDNDDDDNSSCTNLLASNDHNESDIEFDVENNAAYNRIKDMKNYPIAKNYHNLNSEFAKNSISEIK